MVKLKIDWASHDAATHAVMNWHYSKAMPSGKLVKVGAWEDGKFVGVVLFGRGATHSIGSPYGVDQTEACELVRVALKSHQSQTSKIVSIAIKYMKRANPGMRIIISYADSGMNHHGGIYQAMNWIYAGPIYHQGFILNGRAIHPRTINAKYGTEAIDWLRKNVDPNAKRVEMEAKHKYLMPLDDAMRNQILPLAKPYPKRTSHTHAPEASSDAAELQSAEGGAAPTPALE
jgi:hypothetical protein